MPTVLQQTKRAAELIKADGINRSIFRAAVSVGAVGILVKFVATFKEIAVASSMAAPTRWMRFSPPRLSPACW
jgi:hypothetical protein